MRNLTEEELVLAPEWATHYFIDIHDDTPIYESENLCWWVGLGEPLHCNSMGEESVEIKRKPFDITQHDWSDVYFDGIDFEGDINLLCLSSSGDFYLSKNDAIAIARHFKLTGDDIK